MDDVRIDGGRKIAAVAAALRHMGADRTILKEMTRRIRASAPTLRDAIRQSAIARLPQAGGLGLWISKASIRVLVTRGARTAGVRLLAGRNSKTGRRSDVRAIDAGKTRHPRFGDRRHWYLQRVTPGFATSVMTGKAADRFRADTLDAVDWAVKEVVRDI